MLLLYLFVATPVQWWHQHSACASNGQSALEQKITTSKNSDLSFEENCRICSHQYALADTDAVWPVVAIIGLVNTPENFCIQPFYNFSPDILFNKGPPLSQLQ